MNTQNTVRKSICFITHEIITGGIENVLTGALKILHSKYDITVISLFDGIEQAVSDRFPNGTRVINGFNSKNKLVNHIKGIPYLSKFYFDKAIGQKYDFVISLKGPEKLACFSSKGKHKIYRCHNDHQMQLRFKLT